MWPCCTAFARNTLNHTHFIVRAGSRKMILATECHSSRDTQIWLACQMGDPISYLGSPNMWPHEAWIGRNGRMTGFARDNSPVRSGTLRGSVTGLKACAGLCSFAQRVDLNPKQRQVGYSRAGWDLHQPAPICTNRRAPGGLH